MGNFFNPEERPRMQPALVYAGLALATLMKSSELELGAAGRSRAVWLRDAAQTNLEQSLANQWIDLPLAEAALVRTFAQTLVLGCPLTVLVLRLDAGTLRIVGSPSVPP
jgi:hypothetical protein